MAAYHVYKMRDRIPVIVGTVVADGHVQADTKARTMFGRDTWTKAKTEAVAH